jgi:hypothetical protein
MGWLYVGKDRGLRLWSCCIQVRIGSSVLSLWTRQWTFGLHSIWRFSWPYTVLGRRSTRPATPCRPSCDTLLPAAFLLLFLSVVIRCFLKNVGIYVIIFASGKCFELVDIAWWSRWGIQRLTQRRDPRSSSFPPSEGCFRGLSSLVKKVHALCC